MKEQLHYKSLLRETPKAVQINFGGNHKVWLPFSQIELDRNKQMVYIPDWLYQQKFEDGQETPICIKVGSLYQRNERVAKVIGAENGNVLYQYLDGRARFHKTKLEFLKVFTRC